MKISDGNWLIQPNFKVQSPRTVFTHSFKDGTLTLYAPIKDTGESRANQLDTPMLTLTVSAPRRGIIRVHTVHHAGGVDGKTAHELFFEEGFTPDFKQDDDFLYFISGPLTLRIAKGTWQLDFMEDGQRLTGTSYKNDGFVEDIFTRDHYMFERLDLGVGECVYGLGERFTPFVKNGQSVETWNRDGGTSTEQAYKNIPFYLTSKGYGVFVNHPECVSFEVASEKVSKVQFSVKGQELDYCFIAGPEPADVLNRYTALTGRPALPPAWSFGLWLTTSFTTNYDEDTVTSFIDGMAERDIPLHVFHYDCFWMKAFEWCNFTWDEDFFPDPEGMLKRWHQRGLHICVWINPYIGQKSPLFAEGKELGYLLKRPDGSVWQWDLWQPGLALVDFTNPEAVTWYQDKLRSLCRMGVDCFKTDFGERVPTDVVYFNGADPLKMHNYYTFLYNQTVFEVLEQERGKGEAVLFARSACAGGQRFPCHWGGDCYATYESMAETLRGGLSLALSGFAFWSHDIGGFETTATADLYKRWTAFGLLSSHSRLHGSKSYRVPWAYDDEACDVLRFFTKLKCTLMPYLYAKAAEAAATGLPVMRPMVLAFPHDPICRTLDTQYMLGDRLLVAPVFSETGEVEFYLPEGTWTSLIDGTVREGGRYYREKHGYLSLPLYVRGNTLLPRGTFDSRPDYDYAGSCRFELYALQDGGSAQAVICDVKGKEVGRLSAGRQGDALSFTFTGNLCAPILLVGVEQAEAGCAAEYTPRGLLLHPEGQSCSVTLKH